MHWNKKVAANRGPTWRKALMEGRINLKMTRLRERRCELLKTQEELAIEIGISTSTYAAIEKGQRLVQPHIGDLVAKKLGKRSDELFNTEGEKWSASAATRSTGSI